MLILWFAKTSSIPTQLFGVKISNTERWFHPAKANKEQLFDKPPLPLNSSHSSDFISIFNWRSRPLFMRRRTYCRGKGTDARPWRRGLLWNRLCVGRSRYSKCLRGQLIFWYMMSKSQMLVLLELLCDCGMLQVM